MLALVLFISFWVVVTVALVFVAIRGGLGGARQAFQSQSRGGRRTAGLLFAFIYIVFGGLIPGLILAGNKRNTSKQVAGIRLTASEKRGRILFGEHCGVCHTLASANAVGAVGPNLDTLQPPATLVLHTINYGCLQNPSSGDQRTCLGNGVMPSAIVAGRDAQDVSNYVARVAGR